MAKKKKKSKRGGVKKARKRVAAPAMLGTFAGGVLGKVVEKLLADTIRDFVRADHHRHRKRHVDDGQGHDCDDVAARLLEALADGGPKAIPQLLADTSLGLSPMLTALHTLRDFRLVTFVGEPGGETVEVTRPGAEAATVLRSRQIRTEAARMLGG